MFLKANIFLCQLLPKGMNGAILESTLKFFYEAGPLVPLMVSARQSLGVCASASNSSSCLFFFVLDILIQNKKHRTNELLFDIDHFFRKVVAYFFGQANH